MVRDSISEVHGRQSAVHTRAEHPSWPGVVWSVLAGMSWVPGFQGMLWAQLVVWPMSHAFALGSPTCFSYELRMNYVLGNNRMPSQGYSRCAH